ncbi:MAG TPA: FKBP-type peptidyl-prolyl cis-trans isomerase [Acidobacteriota bacterium]|nr:FKBP-type peptidyl-prolyl cis-trans isomerase [Acidobacteriota bacterium]
MKITMRFMWLPIALVLLTAVYSMAQDEQALTTDRQKISYGIGIDAGKSLMQRDLDLDLEFLIKGLRDGFNGNDPMMSEEELRAALAVFVKGQEQKQLEALRLEAEKNMVEGEKFLVENRSREGVLELASGLQYKILKAGEGKKPTLEDSVEVHYRGTLIDGTEFDSSFERGESVSFPLSQIISGWKEALQLMTVGSRWQLFIPPDLAYGSQRVGVIGPGTTLIFEVELLSIK